MRFTTLPRRLAAAVLFLLALPAPAQEPAPGPIQDNSFLMEEAYNQEPGVVQEIQTYSRRRGEGDWIYTFTQEWPVPGQTHQLSFTLPVERAPGASSRGLGDLALNYRYQLLGDGAAKLALSPRLSLLVPTGSADAGRGSGSWGAQLDVPLSLAVGTRLVAHTNLGATWLPDARRGDGSGARSVALNAGQSVVFLAHPLLNVLVEAVYTRTMVKGDAASDDFLVSPGVRGAINLGSLQIVPGIAFPIGVGPSSGQRSVFLYLSFEHPLWTPRAKG